MISGSLRSDSLNTALLRAAAKLLPAGSTAQLAAGLADLPHYNEELDTAQPPAPVAALRQAVASADAVVIATPEYNGTTSGALKDALDWCSRPYGAGALAGKKVAVLAASPSPNAAAWAREEVLKALTVIGAEAVPNSVGIGAANTVVVGDEITDPAVRGQVADLLAQLA
jgi:NAD(P)H-dependent FMN reductase